MKIFASLAQAGDFVAQAPRGSEAGFTLLAYRIATVICLGSIVIAVGAAFTHLDADSLWLDELFTAYFSSPTQSDFWSFLNRAAEDVHPPGYYLTVWISGRFFGGDIGVVARGVSAVSAALMLLVLYFAFPHWVGRPARLIVCTMAATSTLYFSLSQEARSYAFTWLLCTVLLLIVIRLRKLAVDGKPLSITLILFAGVGTISGLTHPYMLPLCGGLVAMLICFGVTWRNRALIAIAGIAVLVPNVGFILWHGPRIVADLTNTWFRSDATFLYNHTRGGVRALLGFEIERFAALTAIAVAAVGILASFFKCTSQSGQLRFLPDVAILLGGAVLALILVLAVTVLVAPSYSSRFFLVLAPLYWILIGTVFEAIYRMYRWQWATILYCLCALAFMGSTLKVMTLGIPHKQAWRESSQFVASLPGCEKAVLPVIWFTNKYISGDGPSHFHGYYLTDDRSREWISQPRSRTKEFPDTDTAIKLVADRVSGLDECPLLLWAVHHTGTTEMEAVRNHIEERFDPPAGTSIVLEIIKTAPRTALMRFFSINQQGDGFVIHVERK